MRIIFYVDSLKYLQSRRLIQSTIATVKHVTCSVNSKVQLVRGKV